jgi:hypothetical protein
MNWKIDENKYIFDEDNDEYDIAELVGPQENRSTNGLLICAAPQLLEALEALVAHNDYILDDSDPVISKAIKAICKAKGVCL